MNSVFDQPVIVLGGGGHARVILDLLVLLGANVLGVTTAEGKRDDKLPSGVRVLGIDDAIYNYPPNTVLLANGLGLTKASSVRRDLHLKLTNRGYKFPALVHPSAFVSPRSVVRRGCQIMAGAIVQAGAIIDEGVIINTSATVDHDCEVGPYAFIAPGVTLSGEVIVGECSFVGAGAKVVQGVKIGAFVTIGAGSVVIHNVHDFKCVVGAPARVIK